MPRAVLPLLGLAVLSAAACGGERPPEWRDGGTHRWRPLERPGGGDPGFTRQPSSRTGVAFANRASEEAMLANQHLQLGSGVAIGDVDGDGRADVYLARLEGPNALYLNRGGWRFEEAAGPAGVAAPDRLSTGAALADVDGDGDADLVLTALGGPNALFRNDGAGGFSEEREEAGLESSRGSMSPALADVDGDGDLDLYVANYKVRSATDLWPPWERAWEDVVVETAPGEYGVARGFREHYRVLQLPELGRVVRIQRGEPDVLYLNDGSGRFEAAGWTSGRFLDEGGQPLDSVPDFFGLAAAFHDADGDGDPDLYVCNDFEDPDQLWLNRGDGVFRAAPAVALRTTSNAGMAVDFADVDRDGHVDFFELDMQSADPLRRRVQRPSHTALPKRPGAVEERPQMQRNTLQLGRGDATWAQVADYAGVAASEWSWGALFLDVDLDGWEDLLVTNGHVWDVQDRDADARVERATRAAASDPGADWRRPRLLYPDYRTPNVAFRNRGDLTFADASEAWGWAAGPDVSHGLAAGDLDGDGDLDVVVNRLGDEALLLRNDAGAPRVAVRLRGRAPNTAGVGARVRLLGGPGGAQEREVRAGGLYLSGPEPLLSFAAGDGGEALALDVRWRSGRRTRVGGVRAGRLYEVREPSGEGGEAPGAGGAETPRFFEDVGGRLGHVHADSPFDDYARQPLLPNKLSQLGPGLAWHDLDRDGDPDLAVGAGRGGRAAVFLNEGGRFRRLAPAGGPLRHDLHALLGAPAGRRGTVLLAAQSGYEEARLEDAVSVPAVVRLVASGGGGGPGPRATRAIDPAAEEAALAAGDTAAPGPLAMADVDGDGDLDLFVGGRVVPGAYPISASSRLLLHDAGRWRPDPSAPAAFRSVGLVSGALFADVDGDADPDLVLALEWGPPKLFVGEAGAFRDATEDWGLAGLAGRWNGVAAGDLDADGRQDLVLAGWGLNTRYRPRETGGEAGRRWPGLPPGGSARVYYGYFDGDPTLDVVEAREQTRAGRRALYPLEPPSRLLDGLPALRRRYASFRALAAATLEEVLERDPAGVAMREAVAFEHLLLLNRGGRFEPRPLPRAAQLSPAFGVAVADLDGDGREDVLLSQNFFPTEPETPRLDAGRGLWLRGDGTGGLEPVPAAVSGIEVYGDGRAAALADFDGDGRVDVAMAQNGAATRLFRNRGAEPGLRVRLVGPSGNPDGVGATIRLLGPDGPGPAREVRAGSGTWSQDGAVQVLGGRERATAVRVRWPGGRETTTPVEPGTAEVVVRAP